MLFSLTTRWNAGRHETGEAMLDEILALGFDHVELGFDLRAYLVPGVLSRIRTGAVTVDSIHAYCPLPPAVQVPTPEPFTLASPDPRLRSSALHHLENTIRFAAEIGARVVVAHAGNVDMTMLSPKLVELTALGQQYSEKYDKTRMKLLLAREKAAARQLPHLYAALEKLMPLLESTRRILALEILPTWEAIPTELELEKLIGHFNSPWLRGWHDMGHGQIRENLGLSSHARWVRRLRPLLAGLHIHDVLPPAADHLMPPLGKIDFSLFRDVVQGDIVRVLEPNTAATADEITTGRRIIEKAWSKED
jgi:sugar phosphate isomerase/epimerase